MLDSQGVIQRIWNLQFEQPRSWIEQALRVQMQWQPRALMWVRGHQGEKGNEEADMRAGKEVYMGWRLQKNVIATPAGTRQEFPSYPKAPAHLKWPPRAALVKGLVYQGPPATEIGKPEEPWCVCDNWTPQNAAHLLSCPWVGDGKGRTSEQMRSGAGVHYVNVNSTGRAGTGPSGGERPPDNPRSCSPSPYSR